MECEVYNETADATYKQSNHGDDTVDWFEVVYGIETTSNTN